LPLNNMTFRDDDMVCWFKHSSNILAKKASRNTKKAKYVFCKMLIFNQIIKISKNNKM
jgi:hypothetical protein